MAASESKHCLLARYYPFKSFGGYYMDGGGGILTNSDACENDDCAVAYAFFIRAATGYDFTIGTHTQLGVGLKYHTLFYHATPSHELSVVVEINWFLP